MPIGYRTDTTVGGVQKSLASLCLAALLAGLAACATRQPPMAAMVPQEGQRSHGYSETDLGDGRYEVRFVSPLLPAAREAADDHGLADERELTHNLALLRAAQLAQENGYPAFRVVRAERDVDVDVRTRPIYVPAPYYWPHRYRPGWPNWYGPYDDWPWYDYGYGPGYGAGYRTTATGRITVTLTVTMLRQGGGDDAYPTAETLERLRRQYASASFPQGR